MKPRELCEKAWQEIAGDFPDFKIISKGQTLKKTSKNKDLAYEIYFQANRNNYECSVEFVPHIYIYSKGMKKADFRAIPFTRYIALEWRLLKNCFVYLSERKRRRELKL